MGSIEKVGELVEHWVVQDAVKGVLVWTCYVDSAVADFADGVDVSCLLETGPEVDFNVFDGVNSEAYADLEVSIATSG